MTFSSSLLNGICEISRSRVFATSHFRVLGDSWWPEADWRRSRRSQIAPEDLGLLLLRTQHGIGVWALGAMPHAPWLKGSEKPPSLGAL